MDNKDGDIYVKWLSRELTEAELKELKESGELPILEKIISETDTWETPAVKTSFSELKERLNRKTATAKVVHLYKRLAIAASVAIFATLSILIYYNYNKTVTYQTLTGETKTITLPDNTSIILSGNSSLSYKEHNWEQNRLADIQGEVYFDVKRKGDFVVSFNGGSVAVKGTAFKIIASQNFKQVKCYHGKVLTLFDKNEFMLGTGMGVDSDLSQFTFTEKGPGENGDYTRFENAKLAEVLASLSSKFGYKFELKADYRDKIFTGQYDNTNGEKALGMVFNSLSIPYELKGKNVILK